MPLYLTKTPKIVQKLFKNYLWRFFTEEKVIYLTFDDGPTLDITLWTLEQLKSYNAQATFFCIGKNIENHPEIFEQIILQNHTVGNHTHNHLKGTKNKTKKYIENTLIAEKSIQLAKQNIEHKLPENTASKLFRPPYGKMRGTQSKKLRSLGYKIVMWDVLSADFDLNITKEACLKNVLNNSENGSIIVFHDSLKAKENLQFTLPKVLEYYSQRGYVFKKIEG